MKKIILMLLVIGLIACKKQPNNSPSKTSNVQTPDYSGTYVNPNNNGDYIKLSNTSNDNQNHKRYHVDFCWYTHCTCVANQDTVLESSLINAPGWGIYYNTNGSNPTYTGYMLYNSNTIKITLYDNTGTLYSQTSYNKQ